MMYGLYLSAQGAEAQSLRQAILANNMANTQTTAFKRDFPVFQAFATFDAAHQTPFDVPPDVRDQTGGVALSGTIPDFTQGPLDVTGRELDMAIMGPGFFEVAAGGQRFLTRNGKLTIGADNTLVTADQGFPILDIAGQPLPLIDGVSNLAIANDGTISGQGAGGEPIIVGQVNVVEPLDPSRLMKAGDGLYESPAGVRPAIQAQVRQGVLEGSTSDPVHGMVELIETSRAFEMNMNMVRYQDEMAGQFIQAMARK